MSPFAIMLETMADRLRAARLASVTLHFDFRPDAEDARKWACWYVRDDGAPVMAHGRSGEESLRFLVAKTDSIAGQEKTA